MRAAWWIVVLWTCAVSLAPGRTHAHVTEIAAESIGVELGLDDHTATAVLQDRAGFLWIGTRDGLILYDGHSTRRFEHDASDPASISDNLIRTLYEDREGRLWVGTNSGGLARLDRSSWRFEHYRHDSNDPTSLSHDSVNAILQTAAGELWIGTQIGLNRLDVASGHFERFLHDPTDPASIAGDYVYALHEGPEGDLWVGSVGAGVDRFDGRTFVHHRHDPSRGSASLDDVFAIETDSGGAVWLATEAGLARVERDARRIVPVAGDDAGGPARRLSTSLERDGEGLLWLGTWGGGVSRFDPAEGRFVEAPDLGADVRVASLAIDRAGRVWIGTWGDGLFRSSPAAARFDVFGLGIGSGYADTTAVYAGDDGALWVGTWGRGLAGRARPEDPVELRFGRDTVDDPGVPSIATVLSVLEDRRGRLWVGTMDGLYRIRPEATGDAAIDVWLHDPSDRHGLGLGYVTAALEARDGTLWFGVGGSGLHRLREDGAGFDRFVHDPADPRSPSDDYVTALAETADGTLWVGTRSGGLNALDPETGAFRRFLPDADDPGAIGHHYVTDLAVDASGDVWVATGGSGVARLARDGRDRFEHVSETEGLIDDNVRAFAFDGDGTLWIGTGYGLSRYDPASGRTVSYAPVRDLPVRSFNVGAASRGGASLYFGTSDGTLAIPAGMPFVPPRASPTVLRSIRALDRPFATEAPPWSLERLVVPYGEVVSFEFAVLDYGETRRHRFAYRLEGVGGDWVDIGDRREITFTDLDPGRYTLSVRGRNAQGVWSEASTPLAIEVPTPWWMTAWFRLGLGALAIAAAIGFHRVRTRALEHRNRRLVELKEQRERALVEVRESRQRLHDAYGRLRALTRRLEHAKEEERRRIARELHDEMGQALTAAKINVQLLSVDDARATRVAESVALIDRLIGHVRALSIDLRPPLLDEMGLGPALRSWLEAQAQRTELDLRVDISDLPRALPAELEIAAFRFVQEALTNVVRHAEASRADVRVRSSDGALRLEVRDDGRGFDVDAALEAGATGAHLGLLGMRERAEGLGGELDIRSAPGEGAEIRCTYPVPELDAARSEPRRAAQEVPS